MRYISTRGQAPALSFSDAVLTGLASDGGLYVPETLPQYSPADLVGMASLDYAELAFLLITPFTNGEIEAEQLRRMIDESYASFRHAAVAPLVQLSSRHFVQELFHGPTLAFKDFALQLLGRLVDHLLRERAEHATVIGATSGDTGSAAIAGFSGKDNLDIFILHPYQCTSEVQRRQMTTVSAANVHNLAVKGTFDDCQDIVKALFADTELRRNKRLIAVNSINWARILAQTVYYFYAALRLGAPARAVSFSVPTGNFGDIFAGYLAQRMGLPIDRLIIASNRNDILTRCVKTGTYGMHGVIPSLSPSMDIQISSNFERLLFDLYHRNGEDLASHMQHFRDTKSLTLSTSAHTMLKDRFDAHAVNDEATTATIAKVWKESGYLLDPHTAVGVAAAEACGTAAKHPVITLATAHPAKFPDAVRAATGISPALPPHLADLFTRDERYEIVENSVDAIKQHVVPPSH